MFCVGTLYVWGIITTAVTAHMRKYDPSLTYNDTLMVYATALLFQGLTMFLGGILEFQFGARLTCLMGGYLLVLGTILSATVTSFAGLLFTNGVMFGLGIGICYTGPMVCASRWLPEHKGLVSGLIVGGFGGGACGFGLLATYVLEYAPAAREDTLQTDGYYSPHAAIANAVPALYTVLGATYFVFISAGAMMLTDSRHLVKAEDNDESPGDSTNNSGNDGKGRGLRRSTAAILSSGTTYSKLQQHTETEIDAVDHRSETMDGDIEIADFETSPKFSNRHNKLSETGRVGATINEPDATASMGNPNTKGPYEILRDPLGWHVASCFALTALGGMFIAGTYKTYGQQYFMRTSVDESAVETFLSAVGSVGALFNAGGRVVWGVIADRIGAVYTLIGLSFFFSLLLFSYSMTPAWGEAAFAIWTFGILFFEGGNFALYMPVTIQLFGIKSAGANYGLIFTCYSLVNVASISTMASLDLSFLSATCVMGVVTLIGCVNLFALRIHMRNRAIRL
jgi:MFS family permease